MRRHWLIILMLILLFCLVGGCSKSTKQEDFELAPWVNVEAELIALCLSGQVVAPDSLSNQILSDLSTIRSTYGDDFKRVKQIGFRPPWIESCLIVSFDDTTAQQVANGEYHDWDELNQRYQVTKIDTTHVAHSGYVKLYFENTLHPFRLGELYAILPGGNICGTKLSNRRLA